MEFIQIVGIIFAAFGITIAVLRFRSKKISLKSLLIWCTLWAGVMVVALMPWTTVMIAEPLGIGRGIDLVVYLSIIVLYYILFRIYIRIEETQRAITSLVRELAMRGKKK